MSLESQFNNIGDLNKSWPTNTDPVAEGAAQIRGVKSALQGNVTGSATETGLFNGSNNVAKGAVLRTQERGVDVWTTEAQGIAELQFRDLAGVIAMRLAAGGVGNVSLIARKAAAIVQLMAQYLGADATGVTAGVRASGALTVQAFCNLLATLETQPGGFKALAAAATSAVMDLEVGGVNLGGFVGNGTTVTVRSLTGDVHLSRVGGGTSLATVASGIAMDGPNATDSALQLRNNLGVLLAGFQAFQGQAFLDGPAGGQFNIRGGAATYLTLQPAAVAVHINNAQAAIFAAGVLNVLGGSITQVAAPFGADHAANKGYVDSLIGAGASGAFVPASGTVLQNVFGPNVITCNSNAGGVSTFTTSKAINNIQLTPAIGAADKTAQVSSITSNTFGVNITTGASLAASPFYVMVF